MPESKEVLVQGPVSSLMNGLHNDVSDTKCDIRHATYLLEHVKYDFYKKGPDLLHVVVYVKEIAEDSLQVNFGPKSLHLKFQTRSKEFLKLHDQVSEETVFEWRVSLRHKVDDKNCKHVLSPTKLSIILKKAYVMDQWNSLEELNVKCTSSSMPKNGELHIDKKVEISGTEIKLENGDKIVNTENNCLGLKGTGVPPGQAENKIESFRTKNQTVNNSDCGLQQITSNGLDHDSEDVLCNKIKNTKLTGECICDSASKGKECNSENNYQLNSNFVFIKSNDTKKSSLTKGQNKFTDKSCEADDVALVNDENFRLNYDAKKQECRPGSVGLVNHGNFCYINSVVQCLSSVRELRTYLLSKKHCGLVNCKNKNGYLGELVSTFDCLLQQLWSGKERYVSTSKLKHILGRKHKQFVHYGQGDAQEILTFLLDGLHEELKDDKKKNVTEFEKNDSQNISQRSQKHWDSSLNGNQSVISDLFQGQSVFEICCRTCSKPSTGFDYWMQLNLPIPDDPKYLSVYVFFLDKKPLHTKLTVCQRTRCADLLMDLSHLVEVPAHCLILLRSQFSRISHIYDPIEEIELSSINQILIACEIIPKQEVVSSNETEESIASCTMMDAQDVCDVVHISVIQRLTHRVTDKCSHCAVKKSRTFHCSKCCRVAYCNSECQRKDWKNHRQYCTFQPLIIGTPFIISMQLCQATLRELKKKSFHYARYSVAQKNGELASGKFHLTLLENLTDYCSKGTRLVDNGDAPVVDENVCIALDWEATTLECEVISKDLDCNVHESVNDNGSSDGDCCSLEECLNLYWKPENISKDCGWRCDNCKDVRAATRKVMICKHPENLIIHIKRFSYSGNGRKISKHIDFPLRGLDLSAYAHPEITSEDGAVYDLRAVCSHYGLMNFGHYIAFCKPYSETELETLGLKNTDGWLKYDDSKVNCVKETKIKETQAYILFYRRRKNASSSARKQTSVTESKNFSKTDQSNVVQETSELSSEEGSTVNKMDADDILFLEKDVEDRECRTPDGEILLEDQLD